MVLFFLLSLVFLQGDMNIKGMESDRIYSYLSVLAVVCLGIIFSRFVCLVLLTGVFLHVLGDALGSIAAIIGGLCIWLFESEDRYYADPVIRFLFVHCFAFYWRERLGGGR